MGFLKVLTVLGFGGLGRYLPVNSPHCPKDPFAAFQREKPRFETFHSLKMRFWVLGFGGGYRRSDWYIQVYFGFGEFSRGLLSLANAIAPQQHAAFTTKSPNVWGFGPGSVFVLGFGLRASGLTVSTGG